MKVDSFLVELRSSAVKLSEYFLNISEYLFNNSGTPLEFETVAQDLKQDEALTLATYLVDSLHGSAFGNITTTLYDSMSYHRESSMIGMRKAAFYSLESSFLKTQSDDVIAELAKKITYIRGNSPDQDVNL